MDVIYMPYVVFAVIESKKTKKTKIFGHFAECNTRQRAFAECLLPWHSAKLPKNALPGLFAECQYPGTRQSCVHYHVFPSFAECQDSGTRQRIFQKKKFLCRVPSQLGTRQRIFQIFFFFAECWVRKALGKGFFKKNIFSFAECRVRKALGKGFF